METAVLLLVAFVYLLATLLFWIHLRHPNSSLKRFGQIVLALGLLMHWFSFSYELGRKIENAAASSLVSNLAVTAVVAVVCLLLSFRRSLTTVVLFALPVCASVLIAIPFSDEFRQSISLPSLWLWAHIGLMILGEVILLLAAAWGVAFLISERQLRRKTGLFSLASLPSLPTIELGLHRLLQFGFLLMSFGVLLGMFFAKQFWGGAWLLDAKVLAALISWAVYLLLLGLRYSVRSFRGRRLAIGAVVGFGLVVFLSFGVDLFFSSQHQQTGPAVKETQEF